MHELRTSFLLLPPRLVCNTVRFINSHQGITRLLDSVLRHDSDSDDDSDEDDDTVSYSATINDSVNYSATISICDKGRQPAECLVNHWPVTKEIQQLLGLLMPAQWPETRAGASGHNDGVHGEPLRRELIPEDGGDSHRQTVPGEMMEGRPTKDGDQQA